MGDEVEQKVGSDTAPAFEREADEPAVQQTSAQPRESGGDETIVKICKQCMVSQSGGGEYCVHCGSPLVPIRAVRESYVGEVVGGKYEIVEQLGAGGMGEVYLGLNKPLGQRVAVKFLSQKFTADEGIIMRFLNEARSYCKVNHPNAVTLLEYGQHDDGALYLITEFIEGDSLTETLKKTGPFGLDQVISVGSQVCEVLSAAHSQGVIHRDLKPDNIMLMPSTRGRYAAKVLDFGIAKIVDDDHSHGPMTETGSVFGTPEFMSPEQAKGESADPRSDLYAMGVILFYLATGKLPFKGKNKFVVLNKQINERPPRPSDAREDIEVPLRLEAVILKCLNKEPGERYQSADDLLEALEEARDAGSQTARLGAASSDAAVSLTPDPAPDTDAQALHDSATVEYRFDREIDTDPSQAAQVDMGQLDSATGQETELESVDMAREWSDRADIDFSADRSGVKVVAGLVVALLLGGGIFWAMSEEAQTPEGDADGPAVVQAAPTDPDQLGRVLLNGQVLGALAATADNLESGDLDAARRSLETTYLWLDDDELTDTARGKRQNLELRLTRLEGLTSKMQAALEASKCSKARRLQRTMADQSEGLAGDFAARVDACSEGGRSAKPSKSVGARDRRGGAKPSPSKPSEPAPEKPEEPAPSEPKPEMAEPIQPEPAEPPSQAPVEQPAPDEEPGQDEPVEDGEATDGDGATPAEPPAEADGSADDGEEQIEEGGDEAGSGEGESDGFALPPKKID